MSQIVTINTVKITNLDLAKEVAENIGWKQSSSKNITGMGNSSADFVFDMGKNSRYNMGLKKSADGSYSVVVDGDVKREVLEKFVVNYTKQFVENEIKLKGKTFEVSETADEIVIEYEA